MYATRIFANDYEWSPFCGAGLSFVIIDTHTQETAYFPLYSATNGHHHALSRNCD